jgi:hypothetical protein
MLDMCISLDNTIHKSKSVTSNTYMKICIYQFISNIKKKIDKNVEKKKKIYFFLRTYVRTNLLT